MATHLPLDLHSINPSTRLQSVLITSLAMTIITTNGDLLLRPTSMKPKLGFYLRRWGCGGEDDTRDDWKRKNKAVFMQLVAPFLGSMLAGSDTVAMAWKSLRISMTRGMSHPLCIEVLLTKDSSLYHARSLDKVRGTLQSIGNSAPLIPLTSAADSSFSSPTHRSESTPPAQNTSIVNEQYRR